MFKINAVKKVIFVLVLLVFSGAVHAQSVTWNGEFYSGVTAHIDDEETTLFLKSVSAGGASQARVRGEFMHQDETAGFNFEFRSGLWGAPAQEPQFSTTTGGWMDLYQAYGWFKALDYRLSIYAGRMDRPEFRTNGAINPDFFGSGFLFVFTPLTQLDFGFRLYSSAPMNSTLIENATYVPSISYNIPSVVKISGSFRNHTGFGKEEYRDQWAALALDFSAFQLTKGIGFNNLVFEFIGESLGDFYNAGVIKTGQLFNHNISGTIIWIHGQFEQWFHISVPNLDTYTPDLSFWLRGQVSLPTPLLCPTLDLYYVYGSGGFSGSLEREHSGTNMGQHTKDKSVVSVRPALHFRLGGAANVLILEYAFWADLSKDPVKKYDHAVSLDVCVSL
jgi:hypothetical protein